jgi:hypothetical protein
MFGCYGLKAHYKYFEIIIGVNENKPDFYQPVINEFTSNLSTGEK